MHAVKVSKEHAAKENEKNPCFLSNEELKPWLRLTDCSQVPLRKGREAVKVTQRFCVNEPTGQTVVKHRLGTTPSIE